MTDALFVMLLAVGIGMLLGALLDRWRGGRK
jgi:hypothetical protein